MKGQREAKSEGRNKLPWIIAGGVVAVLAAAYIGTCAWAAGRETVLPNVSVAGVDVSNMTAEQARAAIENAVEQKGSDISFTLTYEKVKESLTADQLAVDAAQSAQDAWDVGRENFFTGGPQLVGHMLGMSSEVPLALPEDDPALTDLMDRMEEAVNAAAGDHGYQIEGDRLVMTKGAPVVTVDWETARAEAWGNLQSTLKDGLAKTGTGQTEGGVTLSASRGELEEPDFEAIHREVYAEPKDASLDLESLRITDHVVGVDFDVQTLRTAYENAGSGETFSIPLSITQPKVTKEDLGGRLFKDVLGEATTRVTGSAARKSNVKLAASACNEVILLPGEEFSYNNTTGSRSASKGYLPAPIYAGGRSEDGVGGGICQVSSTIYYAVLHSTLEIVERHDHQFAVSYLSPGMDATVYYGSLDFRFKNSTNYPMKVVTRSYDSKGSRYLEVQLYGTNEDGRYGKPSSAVFDKVAPGTAYKPDPNVARGTLVLDREQYAYTGMKARTYRTICEADGTVVEKQDLGVSSYKMRPNTYFYNPADGDPSTWVNGKPPAPPTTDPGPTTPTDPGTTPPVDPDTSQPEDPGTEMPADPTAPPPSDSGLNPIDPNAAAG